MKPITETELRCCVLATLAKRVSPGKSRLIQEFTVEMGAARVDIALIGQHLEAFELKSDFDDFSRLHNQIHAYNRVFDRITIVTGQAFASAALEVTPAWWGISIAERKGDGMLRLRKVRHATKNTGQDPLSLAMFLWRDEAIDALKDIADITAPRKATRHQLHTSLVELLALRNLKKHVRQQLLLRDRPREPKPSVRCDDLSHLDASYLDFRFLT